jgi:hypothetical protein
VGSVRVFPWPEEEERSRDFTLTVEGVAFEGVTVNGAPLRPADATTNAFVRGVFPAEAPGAARGGLLLTL